MAFFKVKTDSIQETDDDVGTLYVLILKIGNEDVYKIGVTKRPVQERVCEILTSFWHQYRYFPYCYVKRFRKVPQVYAKEAQMHKLLKEYSYSSEFVFSGCTELFSCIELNVLTYVYEKITKDQECSIEQLEKILSKI